MSASSYYRTHSLKMFHVNLHFQSVPFRWKRDKLCYFTGGLRATHKLLAGYLVPLGTALATPALVIYTSGKPCSISKKTFWPYLGGFQSTWMWQSRVRVTVFNCTIWVCPNLGAMETQLLVQRIKSSFPGQGNRLLRPNMGRVIGRFCEGYCE